ncbi:HIT family protein [Streptomyces canus]|uniref:HIT family protein n=1 Tax=Streptomyces canus TaxID=58343 RepID=UPI00035DED4E|nr:hypothetical protein [Streptomyces canus]
MTQFRPKDDLTGITAFPTFPFKSPVFPQDLVGEAVELVRPGESGPENCEFCAAPEKEFIWTDRNWRLRLRRPTPFPGTVILHTRAHWESFADMPSELISEFGPLCARIERAILGLGNVGRVHLYRSGDGHAHFHVWFHARPLGFQQFRGSFLPTWAEILESRSPTEVEGAGEAVAQALSQED